MTKHKSSLDYIAVPAHDDATFERLTTKVTLLRCETLCGCRQTSFTSSNNCSSRPLAPWWSPRVEPSTCDAQDWVAGDDGVERMAQFAYRSTARIEQKNRETVQHRCAV